MFSGCIHSALPCTLPPPPPGPAEVQLNRAWGHFQGGQIKLNHREGASDSPGVYCIKNGDQDESNRPRDHFQGGQSSGNDAGGGQPHGG